MVYGIKPFRLTVITGPMNSGKSKRLIDIVNKEDIQYRYVASKDVGLNNNPYIHSRDGRKINAVSIDSIDMLIDILQIRNIHNTTILVDEVQFIDDYNNISRLIEYLVQHDVSMYVGGLDLDSDNCSFMTTAVFMCYATSVVKLTNRCDCGRETKVSKYINKTTTKRNKIDVGQDKYKGVCYPCYFGGIDV